MRLSLYNLTPWHFLDVDIDAPLLLWTASGHRMKVPALAQWKVMVVWWIGSLKRIVSFYLYSQILAKFVGTTCSMRLSNHSCCLIWHCHMIQLHIEFSILLKKNNPTALIFFPSRFPSFATKLRCWLWACSLGVVQHHLQRPSLWASLL